MGLKKTVVDLALRLPVAGGVLRSRREAFARVSDLEVAVAAMRARAELAEKTDLDMLAAAGRGKGRYRSCRWLEEGVFIEGSTAKICCMNNIGNHSTVLFEMTEGAEDNGHRIIESRDALRLANQTNKAPCEGCFAFREAEWEAKRHLAFVAISGFLHCNLACTYCVSYAHNPSDRGGAVLDELKRWLEQGLLVPGQSTLDMGGGESTLHREFNEIAEFAFSNDIGMLIFTNGTHSFQGIKNGLTRKRAHVVCSVDAGTRETYRRIKKKDMLDRVWQTLTEYASINPRDVTAKYIVMEANRSAQEIDEFFRRAQLAGVRSFIASANAFQNGQANGELPAETKRAIAYIIKRGRELGEAKPAELFTSAIEQEIEELTRLDLEELRMGLANSNQPGALELSFGDTDTFIERANSIIEERDNFTVLLSSPTQAKPARLELVAAAAAAQGATVTFRTAAPGRVSAMEVTFA